jgi:hypothetical protein
VNCRKRGQPYENPEKFPLKKVISFPRLQGVCSCDTTRQLPRLQR